MHRYIARANIDHYLSVLSSSDLTPQNRDTVTKLLIGEEDRLGHDLEHLQFAEDRANTRSGPLALSHEAARRFCRWHDGPGTS